MTTVNQQRGMGRSYFLEEAECWKCSENVQMNDFDALFSTETLLRGCRICGGGGMRMQMYGQPNVITYPYKISLSIVY